MEKRLRRVAGVEEVSVNAVAGAALVAYDQEVTGPANLKRAIEGCGYSCPGEATPHHLTAKRRHVGVAAARQPRRVGYPDKGSSPPQHNVCGSFNASGGSAR